MRERLKDWRPRASRPADDDGISLARRPELHAIVQANSPLRVEHVELPGTDVTIVITRPSIMKEPYWAGIWPSGVVLAGMIARDPGALRGRRVLELGPGVGVTAVAALQTGADLVVADSEPDALAFCAFNALDNLGIEPRTVRVDWRKPDSDSELFTAAGEGFPLVLAADVIWQSKDVEPLLALLERIVAPGGELWLAAQKRKPARLLLESTRARGWQGPAEECASPWPIPDRDVKPVVTVHRLRKPAAGPS
jgi:predicted nicotinamide N-methyase